jgi:DNA topoisomerase-1
MAKFDLARKLVKKIDKIRTNYTKELTDKDDAIRQRATAVWVIDKLALRAGNEKNVDEAADTVGCCSLRVEHIKLHVCCFIHFLFVKLKLRYF